MKNDPLLILDPGSNPLSITGFSESSLSRSYLTGGHVHFESQAFSSQIGLNPLCCAAAPLLNLTSRLREQTTTPDLDNLHKALCHEVRTLEYRAHAYDYRPQIILAARYLICALVDETILMTNWGKTGEWLERSLLTAFHQESWGGERFFTILERCSENPNGYIDLLELGYVCLSLGFQGKYQQSDFSPTAREIIVDNLYQLIRKERGDFPNQLSNPEAIMPIEQIKKHYMRLPSVGFILIITGFLLGAVFIPYYLRLNQLIAPLLQTLDHSMPTEVITPSQGVQHD